MGLRPRLLQCVMLPQSVWGRIAGMCLSHSHSAVRDMMFQSAGSHFLRPQTTHSDTHSDRRSGVSDSEALPYSAYLSDSWIRGLSLCKTHPPEALKESKGPAE